MPSLLLKNLGKTSYPPFTLAHRTAAFSGDELNCRFQVWDFLSEAPTPSTQEQALIPREYTPRMLHHHHSRENHERSNSLVSYLSHPSFYTLFSSAVRVSPRVFLGDFHDIDRKCIVAARIFSTIGEAMIIGNRSTSPKTFGSWQYR